MFSLASKHRSFLFSLVNTKFSLKRRRYWRHSVITSLFKVVNYRQQNTFPRQEDSQERASEAFPVKLASRNYYSCRT